MTDKEVGKLWRNIHDMKHWSFEQTKALIRKLVEERARIYWGRRVPPRPLPECRQLALRDFGIDPETWK